MRPWGVTVALPIAITARGRALPHAPLPAYAAVQPRALEGDHGFNTTIVDQWGGWSDEKKLEALRELVTLAAQDPRWRWFVANNILKPAGVEPRDYDGQVAAILKWVQTHIYYTNEHGEQVQTPDWTIKVGNGDCDDLSVLTATLAESIGLKTRFVLAGKNRRGGNVRYVEGSGKPPHGTSFFHIYLEIGTPALTPVTWIPVEPTLKEVAAGHDVLRHGMPVRTHKGSRRKVTMPEFGALGASYGTRVGIKTVAATSGSYGDDEYGPEPTFTEAIADALHPKNLIPEILSGAIIAFGVGVVVDRIERWRK